LPSFVVSCKVSCDESRSRPTDARRFRSGQVDRGTPTFSSRFTGTGRPAELREATERNLQQAGYHPAGVVLQPPGAAFKSAVDFKAPERRKIAESGYTIILSMGDQQSDLNGGYAEKTFKLPNPVYFLP